MKAFRQGMAVLGIAALAGLAAPAAAQERGTPPPPPEPHNLQVLPKSTTTQQILPIMRNITQALGVNCGYCHQWTGPGAAGNDFAVDVKPTKAVARVMMQMTNEINQKLRANINKPADQLTQVTCITCHRGEAIPKVPPPAPAAQRGNGRGAEGGAAAPAPQGR